VNLLRAGRAASRWLLPTLASLPSLASRPQIHGQHPQNLGIGTKSCLAPIGLHARIAQAWEIFVPSSGDRPPDLPASGAY